MKTSAHQHSLRLVGIDDADAMSTWSEQETARRQVMAENHAAAHAGLSPTDPRWVLAVRTQRELQGSMLTNESRRRLHKTAKSMGLRPFDANVIIAVVQDHAREGRALDDAEGTLALVAPPMRRETSRGAAITLAVLCGLIAGWLLIRWFAV